MFDMPKLSESPSGAALSHPKTKKQDGGERESLDNDLREARPPEITFKMFTRFHGQKSLPPHMKHVNVSSLCRLPLVQVQT